MWTRVCLPLMLMVIVILFYHKGSGFQYVTGYVELLYKKNQCP